MAVDIMNAAADSGNNGQLLYRRVRRYFSGGQAEWTFGAGARALANVYFDGLATYLEKTYPTLTPSEIQMCCLIALGATPSCISLACGYEHHVTFYNKRTKIRKKMNLETSESFEGHLTKLSRNLSEWNFSHLG